MPRQAQGRRTFCSWACVPRYRLSQREVAAVLGKHEGNLSRQTDHLREQCLDFIGDRLVAQGWTGDDLSDFVRTEMPGVLLDDPRLSVDHLARIAQRRRQSTALHGHRPPQRSAGGHARLKSIRLPAHSKAPSTPRCPA